MKSSIIIILLLALLVLALGNTVQAAANVPALPETFYGALTINNQPAAPGAVVEARGTGVLTGIAGNPLTTTTAGAFGSSSATGSKLTVQGTIADGTPLTFWVNGVMASTSVSNILYTAGETLQVNLAVTGGGSTGGGGSSGGGGGGIIGGGGGEVPILSTINMNYFGQSYSFQVEASGALIQNTSFTAQGTNLVVSMLKGTILKDKNGNIFSSMTIANYDNPPIPPAGMNFLGVPFNFTPDGATFLPSISMQFSFNPSNFPSSLSSKDLAVGYYNAATGQWQILSGLLDQNLNTIKIDITHLCGFAILYSSPKATSVPTTSLPPAITSSSPVPTGSIAATDPPKQLTPSVTATEPSKQPATLTTNPSTSTAPAVPSPASSLSGHWYVYWIIGIAGVLICLVAVLLLVMRKNK